MIRMEKNQSGNRFVKKSRWGKAKELKCIMHPKKHYTRLCKRCLVLLCDKCLISSEHAGCDLIGIASDSDSVFNQLKTKLSDRIKGLRSDVFELHEVLVRKKERMLKKRNETVAEIEHYFNRLKDKLLKDLKNKEKELTNELKTSVGEQETLVSEHIGQCNVLRHNLSETITMLDNLDRLYQNLDRSKGEHLYQLHEVSKSLNNHKENVSAIESARDSFLVIRFIVNPEGERSMLNRNPASVEVLNSRNENDYNSSLERSAIESAENRRSPTAKAVTRSDTNELFVELPDDSVYRQNRRSRSAPRLRPRSEIQAERDRPLDEARNLLTVPKSLSTNSFLPMALDDDSSPRNTGEQSATFDFPNRRLIPARHRNSPSPTNMRENILSRERRQRRTPLGLDQPQDYDLIDLDSNYETPTISSEYVRSSPPTAIVDALLDSFVDAAETNENMSGLETTSVSDGNVFESSEVGRSLRDDLGEGDSSGSEKIPFDDTETTSVSEDPPPPYPGDQRPVTPPAPGELPPPYQDDSPPPPYVQYPETSQQQFGQPRRRLYGYSADTRRKETDHINAPVVRVTVDRRNLENDNARNSEYRSVKAIGPIKSFPVNEMYDKRSAGIFALIYHNENSFLVVDRWNKKLKYFSDTGVSHGGIIFREEPWDITKVSSSDYAVTVPHIKSIYKMTATDDAVNTTGVIVTDRKYACIAYHAESQRYICGQVPQFGEPVIDLIAHDGGPILMSFKSDTSGISLFSYPRYVKVSRSGVIVVCDWNMKCLILLKLDGTFIGKYKGSDDMLFKDPTGIVINQTTESVYAISSTCEAIHKISLSCELQEVIRGAEEFRDGRAIDCQGDRLALGCKNGLIHVYATSAQSHRV